MRYLLKRILSAALAVGLLGSAVMLSVSSAKGPYRQTGENAFDRPLGHPDKALITTAWIDEGNSISNVDETKFDWGMARDHGCPTCGFDPHVRPVVLDLPELLDGSDETAVDVIKRKLGINAFRGSIFEGNEAPQAQLLKHDAPAELKTFDCGLEKLTGADATATCGAECAASSARASDTVASSGAESCTADCKSNTVAVEVGGEVFSFSPNPLAATHWAAERSAVGAESPDRVTHLRECGPELDALANRLEAQDLYAEADALREVAQRLRIKARELKTGVTAAYQVAPPTYQPASITAKPVSTTAASCDCCKDNCGSECKCSKASSVNQQGATLQGVLYLE